MLNSHLMSKTMNGLILLLSALAYIAIGYCFPREKFAPLMISFAIAFIGYGYFLNQARKGNAVNKGYILGMAFRLVFLFAVPMLSDDFYRFIWDGRLLMAGVNPFLHFPAFYMDSAVLSIPGIEESLYEKLNSPFYFSVYPPFSQLVFYISSFLSNGDFFQNVLWLRVFILMAEGVSLYFLPKLLTRYGIAKKAGLIYALNPLVIVELSGNLHFEAYMICFIILFFYFLKESKIAWSGLFFGLAIITKLIPLIFLPLLIAPLGVRKFLQFSFITLTIMLVTSLPFLSGIQGFGSSIGLYFQKFEFNGSIYFLLREVGFWLAGFNLIYWFGLALAVLTFLLILWYAWSIRKSLSMALPPQLMWALSIYLLFSTTVHPWYITPLVLLATFSNFRFPVVWSALIVLTYGQYNITGFEESLLIIAIEYGLLLLFLWYELSFNKLKNIY